MSLLKLWFIRNPVLVSYSICMRQGSSDLSGSQSALACLCVCARAQLGMREFKKLYSCFNKRKCTYVGRGCIKQLHNFDCAALYLTEIAVMPK
jgi:hypothetical protein